LRESSKFSFFFEKGLERFHYMLLQLFNANI